MFQELLSTTSYPHTSRALAPARASVPAHSEIEGLLTALRGEALLVAALAYGLRVRLSDLEDLRVSDVGIFDGSIVIGNREMVIPRAITDDMREFLQERICGCDASESWKSQETHVQTPRGYSVRNDFLFSQDSFSAVRAALSERGEHFTGLEFHSYELKRVDSYLRILGWLQRRAARIQGVSCDSALDLFSKGPRIMRRGRGGIIQGYYLWRALRPATLRRAAQSHPKLAS